ncbi:MAG: EamA family transporter [Mogibacterium sp.]|nr:EamA family transporter [Mogibacterium sp.]MBR2540318.1 EamA family transporter [Mogibacterium sp.]
MKNEQNKGYLMVLAAGTLWGTIGLFATILNNLGMEPFPLAFYRLLFASILLIPVMLVQGKGLSLFRISKSGLISCFLVGLVSQAIYNLCYMNAIEQGGMATASVLLYTAPVFVAIMSRVFFKEPLTKNVIIAIFVNICGCVLTVTGGNFTEVNLSVFGIVMGVAAGFTYGTLPVLSRLGADDEDPYTSSFYGLAFGAVALFFMVRPWRPEVTGITDYRMVLALIGFGIIPSALAYIIYFGGLGKIKETSIVPILASVETVAASIIGLIVFHQMLSPVKILGIALVFGSIVIMNLGKSTASEQTAD